MKLSEAQPKVIWPRLDQYKAAVLARKDGNGLDALRKKLLAEIEQETGVSVEIKKYTIGQFEQIESRHMNRTDAQNMGRGPFGN